MYSLKRKLNTKNILTIVGIISLIPIVFLLYDRFHKGNIEIDIDNKFSFIPYINSKPMPIIIGSRSNGEMYNEKEVLGLLIHEFRIVNLTNEQVYIKNVELKYKYNSKEYTATPKGLRTLNKNDAKDYITLPCHNSADTLLLVNWNDLFKILYEGVEIPRNGILTASALFKLDEVSTNEITIVNDISKVSDMYFVLYTSNNKKYKYKLNVTIDRMNLYYSGFFFDIQNHMIKKN